MARLGTVWRALKLSNDDVPDEPAGYAASQPALAGPSIVMLTATASTSVAEDGTPPRPSS